MRARRAAGLAGVQGAAYTRVTNTCDKHGTKRYSSSGTAIDPSRANLKLRSHEHDEQSSTGQSRARAGSNVRLRLSGGAHASGASHAARTRPGCPLPLPEAPADPCGPSPQPLADTDPHPPFGGFLALFGRITQHLMWSWRMLAAPCSKRTEGYSKCSGAGR